MDNSSIDIKLTNLKVVRSWTSATGNTKHFSYSWSSEMKRVRLLVRPCYLLQSRQSKDERSYHPLEVSFPSSFYYESWTSLQFASLDVLKISLDYPLPAVTWKAVDLRVLDRVEGTVDGTGCGHANFVLGFHTENRKEHLIFCFFFRLIGENQCGCTTRNTEKNLPGLNSRNQPATWSKRRIVYHFLTFTDVLPYRSVYPISNGAGQAVWGAFV